MPLHSKHDDRNNDDERQWAWECVLKSFAPQAFPSLISSPRVGED
jgi:hypothetical protein